MESTKLESHHLSSAAAFVESGIQDACDNSCSICLEAFCDSDPPTVTTCNHEYHLQCILEWCQRSSQCPMCWQPISLKDPTSQELFDAVVRERNIRSNQTQNTIIFRHPTLGEFELQHLPVGISDAELEERIIQHLAAAAALGRSHHISRRDGPRGRLGTHGRPQFLVSTHPNANSIGSVSTSSSQSGGENLATLDALASPSELQILARDPSLQVPSIVSSPADQVAVSPSGSSVTIPSRGSPGQNTPVNQDRAGPSGPSDFQSFSESLKSRFNAVSMRYKESIGKSTRGWKERLFSRNSTVADIGLEVRREVNAGLATVSRMMERLDTRDSRREFSGSSVAETSGVAGVAENQINILPTDDNISASRTTATSQS